MSTHGHSRADARNLELHRAALEKLRANPTLMARVLELTERWLGGPDHECSRPWLEKWREMLTSWDLESLERVVLDEERGQVPRPHPDLCRSMEVDIAPKNLPEREALIEGSIGELSPFHETFGFWVEGIDIHAITLPDGWQTRLVVVDNPNTNGFRGLCLDPGDLAASKLAAGRDKDLAYVRTLIREGMVGLAAIERRIAAVSALGPQERDVLCARARLLVQEPSL